MNSIIEKEKKLSLALTELKKLNLKNPELQSSIENLNQKKNQLEIEKKGLEDNYRLLKEDYDTLSKKLEEMKSREKLEVVTTMITMIDKVIALLFLYHSNFIMKWSTHFCTQKKR